MPNYRKIQLIAYGVVTSAPTQVLPATTTNDYGGDLTVRAETLCKVAEWVAVNYARDLDDPETLKIFVVPEFYFRFGGPSSPPGTLLDSYPNGEQLLPNPVEKILKPHFAQRQFADWLVVGGSMFWHKSAADSGTTHPTYFNTAFVLRGGPDTELTPEERAANDDPDAVPTMGVFNPSQKALMSRIDYALRIDRRQWDAAINPMFREILQDWSWWRWHMFQVHGVNDPTGRPLVFGLEVCLEHVQASSVSDQGVLRTLRAQKPSLPEVDVQIVTSCGMDLDPRDGVAARIDGHALLCDGMQPTGGHAAWPTAKHDRVIAISPDNTHRTAPAATVIARADLPGSFQLGLGGVTHYPVDAVSLWSPAPLVY